MTAKKRATPPKESAAPPKESATQQNEGEGNRTAARAFNADEHRFVESGQVEEKAREAEQALDGSEGQQLRRAEEEGKRHSKGEDPLLNKKP